MTRTVKNATKPLMRAVRFLRAGYPDSAPPRGHIAVLALLPPATPER